MAFDRASFTVCGFVLFNMAITLFIWCYIYEMKCEYFDKPTLLDLNSTLTTGNALIDGILNGLFIATIIALMGIILSQCISHQLISYVILFVKSSFLMTAFIMPANIIYDFYLKFLGSNNSYIYLYTIITSLSFTLLIITAYFTNNFPSFLQQIFSVFNCSFISIYYLRFLPRHTIWFLMIAVIFWDLFAVNSSFGPLKVAALNAQNFNEGILRFMFFIAKNDKDEEECDNNNNNNKEDKVTFKNSENNSTNDNNILNEELNNSPSESLSFSDDDDCENLSIMEEINEERTAYDALNASGQTIIGVGDFIIYGLLVGKAATDMNGWYNLPVLFTIIGILIGLFFTLYLSEKSDKNNDNDENEEEKEDNLGYFPALPIPLAIGIFLYFLSSFIIKYNYWLLSKENKEEI